MDYVSLGRSGLTVSRLALGTMNFGRVTEEPEAHRILDVAREAGINFVDTANVYGGQEHRGRTEEIIGAWFSGAPERRAWTVLATKLYNPTGDAPNDKGLSARNIVRACDASLRRLKTDHIDVYQMHHIDRSVPWDEIWQAMERLVTNGKVLYVGSSNFAGWNIAQANETARARHFLGLVSEQSLYNVCERSIELELLPACRAYGVGVIAYSPLHGGVLGGALHKHGPGRSTQGRPRQYVEQHHDQIDAWEALCRDIGEEPGRVALAWLLGRDGVTAPIVGPRTVDQLSSAVRSLELALDRDTRDRIDSLFPGPGGQAPEAYAW
ncbi:MAG: aldo/keto reductase [Nocardioidaceae bacterium]|nr:aldo/keto reductase [Nocardioidaceae bacterium]